MGELRTNQAKIPPHIFGELVKTKKGFELLETKKYFDDFVNEIKDSNRPLIVKRSSLWAIGHIGQSKKGV